MTATLDLKPQVLDLQLYSGDGVNFQLECKQPNDDPETVEETPLIPLPITGTVQAQVRLTRLAEDPAIVEFAVDLTGANDGIIIISLTGEQTQELVDHTSTVRGKFKGVWDLEWDPEDSDPRTIVQGRVRCVSDVSR